MDDYVFAGGTAVVTGAASGIGEALAHALAARGSGLVLLDRDGDRLTGVADAVRRHHPSLAVATEVVDLADREATAAAAQAVLTHTPRLTLLVNNAGVALGGTFEQVTLEEFWRVMEVNFRATVQLVHALLPALRAAPGSHVANTSSVFGIVSPPGQTAYASSKFAVRGFTEGLRAELAPSGIGVTCIHPGGIRTRIATSARLGSGVPPEQGRAAIRAFDKLLTIAPGEAAETILQAIEQRRGRVLVGTSAKLPDVAARLFPGTYTTPLAALTSATRTLGGVAGRLRR